MVKIETKADRTVMWFLIALALSQVGIWSFWFGVGLVNLLR